MRQRVERTSGTGNHSTLERVGLDHISLAVDSVGDLQAAAALADVTRLRTRNHCRCRIPDDITLEPVAGLPFDGK